MKYLFICLQNKARSPAAARYFSTLLKEKDARSYEIKSAGVFDNFPTVLTKAMMEEADTIFVMDKEVLSWIKKEGLLPESNAGKDVIDLDIPDALDPYWGDFHPEWLDSKNPAETERYKNRYKGKRLIQAVAEKREIFEKYIKDASKNEK